MLFHNDSVALKIRPELGGGIACLRWRGIDVLRPCVGEPKVASELGEFPLAPFVNRIAFGRFDWLGAQVQVGRAREKDAHALHGHAWIAPWREESNDTLLLASMPGRYWPWGFQARRTFRLSPDGVTIGFSLQNTGPGACPAGIGFHPYFPRAEATVRARLGPMVTVDATGIPTGRVVSPVCEALRQGTTASSLHLDHCFIDWDGQARLHWPTHHVTLHAVSGVARVGDASPVALAPMRFAQIFAPPDANFFCFEPQTSMPDAINQKDTLGAGIVTLQEGDRLLAELRLGFSAA